MRVIKGDVNHTEHASSAAWQCSKDNAKLLAARSCAELNNVYLDIINDKSEHQNITFWIGHFAPGFSYLDLDEYNWFKESIIDS